LENTRLTLYRHVEHIFMHKDWQKQLSIFSLIIGFYIYVPETHAENYYDLDIQDLMNMEISVTTKTEKTLSRRESPGIISVITADEILTSGARDLMDVLSLIQGFSFGVDVQGAVGLGIRGNWAHEGKALTLLDGHEMNEVSFGTFSFGGHIPAENIERIEIIRGPGSAIYGGFAELGVINIVTHKGGFSNKPAITMGLGTRGDGLSQQSNHFAYRYKDDTIDWDISSYIGKSERSDAIYQDFYGSSYDMKHDSDLQPELHQMRFSANDFNLSILVDNYHHQSRDLFSTIAPRSVTYSFPTYSYIANYQWKINDHAQLTPIIRYRKQHAWSSNAALAGMKTLLKLPAPNMSYKANIIKAAT
jgi:outer membrane receptor protein involved in Fe transport